MKREQYHQFLVQKGKTTRAEIVRLRTQGKTISEIAQQLELKHSTVSVLVNRIRKSGVDLPHVSNPMSFEHRQKLSAVFSLKIKKSCGWCCRPFLVSPSKNSSRFCSRSCGASFRNSTNHNYRKDS